MVLEHWISNVMESSACCNRCPAVPDMCCSWQLQENSSVAALWSFYFLASKVFGIQDDENYDQPMDGCWNEGQFRLVWLISPGNSSISYLTEAVASRFCWRSAEAWALTAKSPIDPQNDLGMSLFCQHHCIDRRAICDCSMVRCVWLQMIHWFWKRSRNMD